jgi:xanthine dehydrogenase accessory factor
MTENELLRLALAAREEGRNHATITIVSTSGSSPRKNGKLLVFDSGETYGTIGGGAIERVAIEHALVCIRRGKGDYIEYDLAKGDVRMACGGNMALLTEIFRARPKLVICGAGHVGLALASMARPAGFDICFFDDRERAALPGEVSDEDSYTRTESFAKGLADANLPKGAYYVIVTHGHACDAEALEVVLPKQAAYIGMIGSKNKIRTVYQTLIARGVAREDLKKVYSPIGLDIGGETPEEIALAILAEMIGVRYGRSCGHLRKPELVPEE